MILTPRGFSTGSTGMGFAARRTIQLLVLQAVAIVGIGALLGTLPVCNAAAWSPLGDDERTIVERRSVTTVETEPGVRYLHAHSSTGTCPTCEPPSTYDPPASSDTVVERFAVASDQPSLVVPPVPAPAPRAVQPAPSLALTPDRQPPQITTIA